MCSSCVSNFFLEFCDLLNTCHNYVIQLTLIVLIFLTYSCTIYYLQFGGLAYYRPRPTSKTSYFRSCNSLTLEYGDLAPARSVFLQHVTLLLSPLLMRCLNRSVNRHSLESIEETRGNTTTHPPSNYFISGQQRQPSLRPDYTPTFPPTGLTKDALDGGYRTYDNPGNTTLI